MAKQVPVKKLTVPGKGVALVAVGNLADVHESCLHWKNEAPSCDQQLLDLTYCLDREKDTTNKGANSMPAGLSQSERLVRKGLLPVVPGGWLASSLTYEGRSCGAVFWNQELVGSSEADAARAINREVCLAGASSYNLNTEPSTFLGSGGRVFGRMYWDYDSNAQRVNDSIEETSQEKLKVDVQEAWHACRFFFAPVENYFELSLPAINSDLGEGSTLKPTNAGESLSPSDDIRRLGESLQVASLEYQEYLTGRMLTAEVPFGECETRPASRLILLFTYDAPEHLDSCAVGNHPILGAFASHLRTPATFLAFVLDEAKSDADVNSALCLVGAEKIWALLFTMFHPAHQQVYLGEDLARFMKRLVPLLYPPDGPPLPCAPSLRVLRDRVLLLSCSQALAAFLETVAQTHLKDMIAAPLPMNYGSFAEESSKRWKQSILLAIAPEPKHVDILIRAGAVPTTASFRGSMDRPEIFSVMLSKASGTFKDSPTFYSELLRDAAQGLHSAVLPLLFSQIEDKKTTVQMEFPLDIPSYGGDAVVVVGTLGQVVTSAYVSNRTIRNLYLQASTASEAALNEALELCFTAITRELGVEKSFFMLPDAFWAALKALNLRNRENVESLISRERTEVTNKVLQFDYDSASVRFKSVGRRQAEFAAEEAQGGLTPVQRDRITKMWTLKALDGYPVD